MELNRMIPKKRTTNFREDETKLLIQLWGHPQIQNKLYLTHRKAPVMRLLAANMQKHGFYRTPDEIKTRIRNLKCLYHRIKKSTTTGTGIGTVDPDWPHFKAMDEILTNRALKKHEVIYREGIFSDIMPEITIKEEVLDEADINDDLESFTTNSKSSDDEFEESVSMPPLTPAPHITPPLKEKEPPEPIVSNPIKIAPKPLSALMKPAPATSFPSIQIPVHSNTHTITTATGGGVKGSSGLPFPLLILNGLGNGGLGGTNGQGSLPALIQTKPNTVAASVGNNINNNNNPNNTEVCKLLKDLLNVQREHLEIEKERIELEKRKLDFERLVGSQLLTLIPMLGGIFQSLKYDKEDEDGDEDEDCEQNNAKTKGKTNKRKRKASDTEELFKEGKILRDVLESGIKRYMNEDNEHSDTSGISNDSSLGSK